MKAVISELDPKSAETVSQIWQRLCVACGVKEIYNLPTPHFTWFLAEDIDIEKAAPMVEQIALDAEPFTLHTFGLGIFSGDKPVLYLPIVKTVEMIELHQAIWNRIQAYGEDAKLYYSPALWVPHITLALKDLTKENLACAVNTIAFEPIELFVKVDNLALVAYENDQTSEMLKIFHIRSQGE
jgi:2'-5' RNA ligase